MDVKPKIINPYARPPLRESKIAQAVRRILMASLGASFSLLAQASGDTPLRGEAEDVKFNGAFVHGQSVDVSRFAQGNPVPAGDYVIQVAVNGESRGQHKVSFKMPAASVSAVPCFTAGELQRFGVKLAREPDGEAETCAPINEWVPEASANYSIGDFLLDIAVPQAFMQHFPRGYTDPNSWDSGVPALLLDYNANLYVQRNRSRAASGDKQNTSGNLGLLAGLNISDWRLRKRMNTNWSVLNSRHTESQYTYLQRDVTVLKSQLTLGDSTTSGDLFDSLTVRGIQLQSDDRMLPDGLRSYTPVIRGIAETNAIVRITQRGQTIYETTVPSGPFELGDIGVMGYGGDLLVTIIESDGRQRTQVVPFSAPPMLLHAGVSRFGVTVGKLKDDALREEPSLAQLFYQYGLGSMYTVYGGGQVSENYTAVGLGNAFNTPIGGVSLDITRARSDLGNGRTSTGNSYNIGFSKYLEATDTDVTLAAWRYSSKGFYSLRDASLERNGMRNDDFIVDYRTRERFTVNIGQPLWDGARLNLSGNFYNYWNDRASTKQYMLSFTKSERYFSWGLSASRAYNSDGKNINNLMLTFSIPLGNRSIVEKPAFNTLYTTLTRDNDGGSSLQANAIGSQGEQNEFTYGVGTSVSKERYEGTRTAFNGNANYSSPYGQFGSTLSVGNKNNQLSFSANGSVVGHSGGVTVGPRLGEYPFALVEAKGAEGAKLLNGYGTRVDWNGYAIVPSLTPYRQNTVAINTQGLPDSVDVLESESRVIPRIGSAVKVKMKTLVGAPLVLIVKDKNGQLLPIGADVTDERDASLGIIGQGGMAFVRGWQAAKENLYVKNSLGNRLCTIYSDAAIASQMMSASGAVTQVGVVCH